MALHGNRGGRLSRWGIVWRVVLVLLLWPVLSITKYALDFVPGAGPQGGEAVAVLALLFWLRWQAIALAHMIRMLKRKAGAPWQRAAVLLAPLAALVLTIIWTQNEWPPIPAGILVALLLIAPQLWALEKSR